MDDLDQKILRLLMKNARMPVKEIARTLGVTEGTVKSRLFSARRHLRQALTAKEGKPKEAAQNG